MIVWDQAGIKLATPGSAVRLVTDCPNGPGMHILVTLIIYAKFQNDPLKDVSYMDKVPRVYSMHGKVH